MKRHSCGAILYTIYNEKIYIVLGMEKGEWFPFKGTSDNNENNKQTAIREIYEETCGVVRVNKIDLNCNYATKRKYYHIGLIKTHPNIINKFYQNKENLLASLVNHDSYNAYLEKTDIKMFPLEYIFKYNFHDITATPIKYYYKQLKKIEDTLKNKLPKKPTSREKFMSNKIPCIKNQYELIHEKNTSNKILCIKNQYELRQVLCI
jgi:hypothetical protein